MNDRAENSAWGRHMRHALLLLLLTLASTGCISSDRMLRAMPFGEGADLDATDRVNLWPVVYHSGDLTSVLWPFTDFDADGFAIRPLLANNKNEWSLLWPLAGWDTPDYYGWLATAYRGRDNWGIFPLLNIGDEFNYVGPVWWDQFPDHYGLFPVFGRFDHDFYHVGPAWWRATGSDWGFGAFPLLWVYPDAFHLFPLYMQDTGDGRGVFLPGYGLLGGLNWQDGDDYAAWLTPLWLQVRDGADFDGVVLPLYWYRARADHHMLVTPLGGWGWDQAGQTRMLNVLGPVFHHHRSADGQERLTALLWPIFWHNSTPDSAFAMMFPVAAYWRDRQDRRVFSVPLSWGWDDGGVNMVNVLGPVFHWSQAGDYSSTYGLFWLTHRESSPTHSAWWVFPLASGHRNTPTKAPEEVEFNLLFGGLAHYERTGDDTRFSILQYLYRRQRQGDAIRRDFFPFVSWDTEPDGGKFSFLWRLWAYQRRGERSGGHVFFIPWGDRD